MNHETKTECPSYRIMSLEYTDDGDCLVGVQVADIRLPRYFKLSEHCDQIHWLKHFHYPDLETLSELTKRQIKLTPVKRITTRLYTKYLAVSDMLKNWEQASHSYIGHRHNDEW